MHLLPAAAVLAVLLSGHLPPWEQQPYAFWESVAPIVLCLSLSVCYHTCMAHHQPFILSDTICLPCNAALRSFQKADALPNIDFQL